jgi:hypothetical protein
MLSGFEVVFGRLISRPSYSLYLSSLEAESDYRDGFTDSDLKRPTSSSSYVTVPP